ncbi:MAG: 4Fe-4S dicluster domain-containing protein [Planctomycetaceae bacterium]|jgi:ferredoxin|nr:4Fe-4S dicluster domain-containing protein [Planctomycetaceae bacterium]
MSKTLTKDKLKEIISTLISDSKQIIAPVSIAGKYFYREISNSNEPIFDSVIKPANSIKEFFFPQHETICNYCYRGKELVISDTNLLDKEQVIFGSRPCEAASLPILDKVFGWDFQDNFFQQRRKLSTVITIDCKPDNFCFCTSVGLSSKTSSGADAMLIPISENEFEVRIFTDRGMKIFDKEVMEREAAESSETVSSETVSSETVSGEIVSGETVNIGGLPEVKFDAKNVQNYLTEHFADDVFDRLSIRCIGCGVCTYVCPTCHCFDIVDEGGANHGERVKNWDSCQFSFFTYHASGHNPRGDQSARQRNRIQHKFRIYPDKFGSILCTGCGNCARECSVSLGVLPYAAALDKKSKSE